MPRDLGAGSLGAICSQSDKKDTRELDNQLYLFEGSTLRGTDSETGAGGKQARMNTGS